MRKVACQVCSRDLACGPQYSLPPTQWWDVYSSYCIGRAHFFTNHNRQRDKTDTPPNPLPVPTTQRVFLADVAFY